MTKVIIGSNGFIGKFIANELAREYTTLNIHRENSDLENSPLAPLNDQVDIIYCAGIPRSKRDDLEAKKINLKILRNSLLSFKRIKTFSFLSSVEIYGLNHSEKINEETPINPHNYYAQGKIEAEELINSYFKDKETQINILRLPGIYAHDSTLGLFGLINKSIKNKQELSIFNNGEDLRDFVYKEDLLKIILSLIDINRSHLLNIATGKSVSVFEVCNTIMKHNSKFKFKLDSRRKEISKLVFDNSLLKDSIPDLHLTNISEGLRKCNYFL